MPADVSAALVWGKPANSLGNPPLQPHTKRMPRILIATIVGLVGFVAYVVAAVTLADYLSPMHWALQALFFLVAGTLWVFPIRSLMYWAARK